jgi:PhzF family phenazine biosynthesis protein
MTRSYDYRVVDVFTARPMLGNPVAVMLGAEGLDTDAMQAIARWTNLSETTFVLPPTTAEADYQLRIFTPRSELPFAGHPTLGSAHALLEAGAVTLRQGGRLVQQCSTGLVDLRIKGTLDGRRLTFELPPAKLAPLDSADAAELERILGYAVSARVEPAIVDVGPVWMIAQMPDAATVLSLQPDLSRLAALERRLGATGLTLFGAHSQGEAAVEVRTFAPSCGVAEDPVCGSGNGSVAAFQWARGLLPPGGCSYVAAQGRCVGRDGRIQVDVAADGKVHVGGSCVTCVQGALKA